jgi:transposase-like protein
MLLATCDLLPDEVREAASKLEAMYAESRAECEAARWRFEAEYQAKYPEAVQSLTANWEGWLPSSTSPASTGSTCAPPT